MRTFKIYTQAPPDKLTRAPRYTYIYTCTRAQHDCSLYVPARTKILARVPQAHCIYNIRIAARRVKNVEKSIFGRWSRARNVRGAPRLQETRAGGCTPYSARRYTRKCARALIDKRETSRISRARMQEAYYRAVRKRARKYTRFVASYSVPMISQRGIAVV